MAPTTSSSSRITTLDDLTHQNIGLLKKLNTVLFPVPYSEKFYKESLTVGELAKLGISLHTSFILLAFGFAFAGAYGQRTFETCALGLYDVNTNLQAMTHRTAPRGKYIS